MAVASADTSNDWLDDPRMRRWAFTAPQLVFLVGFILPDRWKVIVWPLALIVVGTACVQNARRCGRLHCYFTGPFFLLAAVVLIAYGIGLVGVVPGGWDGLGIGIVVIATLLNVVPARLWGQYHD